MSILTILCVYEKPEYPRGQQDNVTTCSLSRWCKNTKELWKKLFRGESTPISANACFFFKGAHCNFIHRYQRYSIQKNFLNIDRIYSFEKKFFVAGNSLWVRPSAVAKIILQEKYMSKIKTRRRSIWNPRLIFFLLCWHQDLQHVYALFENDRFIKKSSQCTNNEWLFSTDCS